MHPRIWILCCWLSLGGFWSLEAGAKPKPRPAPSPAPATAQWLSATEQVCQLLGTLAHAVTVDRNAGVSLLTTLQQLRTVLHATPELLHAVEHLAVLIYSDTAHRTTPNQVRQAAEVGCLQPHLTAPPSWEVR